MSGNLDAPEGGFDAIMQVVACRVPNSNYCFSFFFIVESLRIKLYFQIKSEDSSRVKKQQLHSHAIFRCQK